MKSLNVVMVSYDQLYQTLAITSAYPCTISIEEFRLIDLSVEHTANSHRGKCALSVILYSLLTSRKELKLDGLCQTQ